MIKLNAVLFSADVELKSIVGMAKNNIIDMNRIYKTYQDPTGGLLNIELSVMNAVFYSTIKIIILIINLISLIFGIFIFYQYNQISVAIREMYWPISIRSAWDHYKVILQFSLKKPGKATISMQQNKQNYNWQHLPNFCKSDRNLFLSNYIYSRQLQILP